MIPSVWTFALLSLGAARVWKLIGDDRILDRPRAWLLDLIEDDERAVYWGDFLVCPWCAGFWIAAATYAGWIVLGPGEWDAAQWYLGAISVLAISAVVGLFGAVLDAIS